MLGGSLVEIETQLLIARNLGYLQEEKGKQLLMLSSELGRILNGLVNAIATDN